MVVEKPRLVIQLEIEKNEKRFKSCRYVNSLNLHKVEDRLFEYLLCDIKQQARNAKLKRVFVDL